MGRAGYRVRSTAFQLDNHPSGGNISRLPKSDLVAVSKEFVVFAVAALPSIAFTEVVNELDLTDPLDLFKTQLILDPEAQWPAVQDGGAVSIHPGCQQTLRVEKILY